jgi:alkane 1-monooxygenase
VFLIGAPWPAWSVLGFAALPFLIDLRAACSGAERRQPAARRAPGVDAILYAMFALQWLNLALAIRLIASTGWIDPHTLPALTFVVITSGLCGAIAGHELIHRRARHQRAMGRLLLASVWYEHFATEHLRGHHARVGTAVDPTTARRGERFAAYLRRAAPGQLAAAWRIDRGAVALGVAVELGLVAGAWALGGVTGVAVLAIQAVVVLAFAYALSYVEHWGLERGDRAVAWDADDRSLLLGMLAITRHADHHARPGQAFHRLRHRADSPKLPRPLGGLLLLAMFGNRRFCALMEAALRRHLAEDAPAAPAHPEPAAAPEDVREDQRRDEQRGVQQVGQRPRQPPGAEPDAVGA